MLINEKSNNAVRTSSRLAVFAQAVPLIAGQLLMGSVSGKRVRFMDIVFSSPQKYWLVLLQMSISIILMVLFSNASTRRLLAQIQESKTGHHLLEVLIVVNLILGFLVVPIYYVSVTDRVFLDMNEGFNSFDFSMLSMTALGGLGAGIPQAVAAHLIARRPIDSWTIDGKPSYYQPFIDKHKRLLDNIEEKAKFEN